MADIEKERALPCPHCGGSDIRFDMHPGAGRGMWHEGDDVWSMCCYDCGATFPNRYRRDLLVKEWNRRAPLADAAEMKRLADALELLPDDEYLVLWSGMDNGMALVKAAAALLRRMAGG